MRFVLILGALFLTGCGVYWDHAGPEVDAYEGARLSDDKVAIIDHASGCFECVKLIRNAETGEIVYKEGDGKSEFYIGANKIRVLPGRYYIFISARLRKSTTAQASGHVDLIGGRTYSVISGGCVGMICLGRGPSYTTYVWMEEAKTGAVLLGERY